MPRSCFASSSSTSCSRVQAPEAWPPLGPHRSGNASTRGGAPKRSRVWEVRAVVSNVRNNQLELMERVSSGGDLLDQRPNDLG